MSDADEAMLCARRRAMQYTNPALRDEIAAGLLDHAFGMVEFADGYRTAAAASAERIKALEEALSDLLYLCENAAAGAFRNGVTDYSNTIDEGEVIACRFKSNARALLKEPDQ